ncbi:type II toxin-antitoxin system RelE/ParE family toxin [Pseudolabrys taiwanensis]|uniref:type II toxin-antitoxin system RelE/ParE family toxin n=1 Tax=Pseudolabrys taiwanensis TaxID=331696 RepID=UPI0013B3E6A9|nr:type II toxin-antitoxin system RelE/ParE family toxin [Pseudolabrys taiwanensis]
MARFELSEAADRDLTDIYRYSYRQFGADRADTYLFGLEECFSRLAQFPELGRPIEHLRPGYFRFEHARHTVFYVRSGAGIRVVRVLHERMDPERHL